MAATLSVLAVILGALVVPSDLYARRVPNAWLACALLLAILLPAATWAWGTGETLWPSPAGLLVGLLVMLPFYAIGWMGAGDVKLFATLGFLLGMRALLPIWVIGCLLTGIHAVGVLLFRTQRIACAPGMVMMRHRLLAWPLWQRTMQARQGRAGLPHAAYLGIATIVTVMHPALASWSFS
jgi:prepilin peptidase CpaA